MQNATVRLCHVCSTAYPLCLVEHLVSAVQAVGLPTHTYISHSQSDTTKNISVQRHTQTIPHVPSHTQAHQDTPRHTRTHQERDADAEGGGEVEERSRETKGTTDKGLGEPELETLT